MLMVSTWAVNPMILVRFQGFPPQIKAYMNRIIPTDELVHGAYYEGDCRNAFVARWNANEQQFYYTRYKYGTTFTDTIAHISFTTRFDVFAPYCETHNFTEIPFG